MLLLWKRGKIKILIFAYMGKLWKDMCPSRGIYGTHKIIVGKLGYEWEDVLPYTFKINSHFKSYGYTII